MPEEDNLAGATGAADTTDYVIGRLEGIGSNFPPLPPLTPTDFTKYELPAPAEEESFIYGGSKIGTQVENFKPVASLVDSMTITIDGLQEIVAELAAAANEAVAFAAERTKGAVKAGISVDLTYIRDPYDLWGADLGRVISSLEVLRNRAREAQTEAA